MSTSFPITCTRWLSAREFWCIEKSLLQGDRTKEQNQSEADVFSNSDFHHGTLPPRYNGRSAVIIRRSASIQESRRTKAISINDGYTRTRLMIIMALYGLIPSRRTTNGSLRAPRNNRVSHNYWPLVIANYNVYITIYLYAVCTHTIINKSLHIMK